MSLSFASWNTSITLGILALLFVCSLYSKKTRRSSLPLPPGPKKWPIIGNMLQLPTSFEWEVYAKWTVIYRIFLSFLLRHQCLIQINLGSDVLHVDAAGKSIVIVNSWKAANELFEKRSSLYSSRCGHVPRLLVDQK